MDELSVVVADFDASAARSDLSRDAALAQMTGTDFLDDRRADMTRTIIRFETLSDHYAALTGASPMQRLLMPHRMGDTDTLVSTWANFAPAMPLTAAGAVAGGAGFLGGWLAIGAVLSLIAWPFRRRPTPKPRHDPPMQGQRRAEGRREPPLTRVPGE